MFIRYRILTHKGVQVRLASVFLLWFLVFSSIFVSIFFFQFSDASIKMEGLKIHDQLTAKMLLVDQARDLAIWYGGIVLCFSILLWVYMMVYSHRLTGPIYKLEKTLERCIHNKALPDKPLIFRKTDAFHELADKFNQFIETACRKK